MHYGTTYPDASRDIEARDAIKLLDKPRYRRLLKAIEDTATASNRINKSAIARRCRMTIEEVTKRLAEMQELLKSAYGLHQ